MRKYWGGQNYALIAKKKTKNGKKRVGVRSRTWSPRD